MRTSGLVLAFADFWLDPSDVCLWRGKQALKLKPKAFDVLHYLVDHAGQLVTKDALWRAIWPDVTVSDAVLTMCVHELRQALEDDAKAPRFIETVHRRGYRFIAPITTAAPPVSGSGCVACGHNNAHRETPVVGREAELAQLRTWFDSAHAGQRQLVFVTGEPGIGKTALVETFLMRLDAVGTIWLGRGQCIEHYGAGEPYLPVLQALGEFGRGTDRDRFLTVLRQYAPSWLVQLPALVSPTERETLQRQTLGVTQERMLRELVEALEVCTAEQALVLFLEDLHWSDPSTVEFLALLARRHAPARLLVVGTYRPVDVIINDHPLKAAKQELLMHRQCQELPLPLLSEAAVEEYLVAKVSTQEQATTPLQPLAQLIHHRTDGNPLFMVTVVEQVLLQRAASPALAANDHITIPATIRQLIEQQVGRLDLQDQRLLDAASVVGAEFSAAAVAAGVEDALLTVEERCEQLARRGTVLQVRGTLEWPDGTLAGRYGFLHALYQEVLYSRLPAAQRVRLHQQVGERVERAYGARAKEIASELALHFEQGRDSARAIQYLYQAAQNAMQQSAHREAVHLIRKGLGMLTTLPDAHERSRQELKLQLALAAPLLATTGYTAPEVERVYTRALELHQQLGDTPPLFSTLLGLSQLYLMRAEHQRAREMAGQCLSLAQDVHNPIFLVSAYCVLGDILYRLGEFSLAREQLEEGLALRDSHKRCSSGTLEDYRLGCLSYVALVLWSLGYADQALQKIHAALTLAQELAHPYNLAYALSFAARLHQFRREVPAAQEQTQAAMALSTEQGFPFWLALGPMLRGWALAEQGQVEEGITQLRQGLSAWQAMGAESARPSFLACLAEAYGKVEQVEEGLSVLAEALAFVAKTGERFYEAELYRLRGELLLAQKSQRSKVKGQRAKVEEAEACFHTAIDIARSQEAKSLELRAATSLARLWQRQGKTAEARNLLAPVYNWFTEGFDTKDLQEAKALSEELSH